MKKFAGVFILLSLMTIAIDEALAESAWVLWSQVVKFGGKYPAELAEHVGVTWWDVQNAYEKRQECMAELEKYISTMERLYKGTKNAEVTSEEYAGRKRLHVRAGQENEVFSAACLPESVDPRPRK